MTLRAGVVGLGNLGMPMARRVLGAGFPLAVFDIDPAPVAALVGEGARACSSCADLARRADVILVIVRNAEQVFEVVFGAQGIASGAAPGTAVCIVSTVGLPAVHELARRAAGSPIDVIDTGVGGGAPSAATGRLSTTVGGPREVFERVRPVLESFSIDLVHVPRIGGGMQLKLIKNFLSYAVALAGTESARLAAAAGIEPELVRHVVGASNLVEQFFLDFITPRPPARLAADADPAEISYALSVAGLCRKDLDALEAFAASVGVELPLADAIKRQAGTFARVPHALDDPRNFPT
jgi:3-hydroxyisobutyrate dehydrogenase-like beta-hydroxyacid dehydrogenase